MTGMPQVDAAAIIRDMAALSRIGATREGGVHREAATAADGEARRWLVRRMREEGLSILLDGIGNMVGLAPEGTAGAPIVLAGSHLDSQPHGGRFDGPAGVVCALHAIRAVRREIAAGRIAPRHRLGLVNWTNEEGSRFAPSLMGSQVFTGALDLAQALAAVDRDGQTMGAALEQIGMRGQDALPRDIAAFLELHIEQGKALEAALCPIGIVEGCWGTAKYTIEFRGRAAHTGPTPMAERRDALLAAAQLIVEVRAISDRTAGTLLSSVGRIDVTPNSTNIVAETVRVFAELRDKDGARLDSACQELEAFARGLEGAGISVAIEKPTSRPARPFDAGLKEVVATAAQSLGIMPLRMHTIAGHDAVAIGARYPSALIFIPCADGVTHHPAELASDADLVTGTEVLAAALGDLVQQADP